jgi:hypothetical protein
MSVVACHCWRSSQADRVHAQPILPGDPTKQVFLLLKQTIYFHLKQLHLQKST